MISRRQIFACVVLIGISIIATTSAISSKYSLPKEHFPFFTQGNYSHQLTDPDCPQYLTGRVHSTAGLGHKSFNYYALLVASQHFGLRYLHQPFPTTSDHANYDASVADWLGYSIDEYFLSDSKYRDLKRVQLPAWSGLDMNDLYEAFEVHFGSFIRERRTECNVIYQMDVAGDLHFAVTPYKYIRPTMATKYTKAREMDTKTEDSYSYYNSSEFNVAIHVRNGDVSPTAESWLIRAAELALNVLTNDMYQREHDNNTSGVCRPLVRSLIRIHIFSVLPTDMSRIGPYDNLVYHVDTPVKETLYHLINADLVIRSSSSFTEIAALASTKALFIHPPVHTGRIRWEGEHQNGIYLGDEEFNKKNGLDSTQIMTLLALRRQWECKFVY